MKRDASAAAPPRPTVVAVVAATTVAQVASVLGLVFISLARNSSGDNH